MQSVTTARSSLPSPFASPKATAWGFDPTVAWIPTGAWNVPLPFPKSTPADVVQAGVASQAPFTTAKSSLWSPLKSPRKTAELPGNVVKVDTVWKVPSPLPNKTPTLPRPLTPTRSNFPSPFRSPASTEKAFPPAEKVSGDWNVPSPFPKRTLSEPLAQPGSAHSLSTTTSSLPSRLKSPVATDDTTAPVFETTAA